MFRLRQFGGFEMRRAGLMGVAAAAATLMGTVAWADETGSNASDMAAAPTATSTAVGRPHLAIELANYRRIAGAQRTYERVRAGATDSYTFRFRGGDPAAVFVWGDGNTDLDLYVYDQNGNRICSDTNDSDTMLCRWTPSSTGAFTIRIKNYGRAHNDYVIQTN